MKKFTTALVGLVGMAMAKKGRVDYDYTCEAKHLEHCLLNDITLYGPNVVLVNLDNRC